MEYIHDAFISYRHLPADMAVAKKLQSLLESRKKKNGEQIRVFRDRSDLPTTSDLGADIENALEQSRYLIIIASPTYRESKWCMRELEHFRRTHGGNGKVLLVLVEGEPDDSFPEILRYREENAFDRNGDPTVVRVEMEPLGADVRGDTHRERMKKLRVEYLRIAAPILGVTFDDLYQRAHRRRIAALAVVIAAMAAFLAYSVFLITQITLRQNMLEAKQQELYQNESTRLANEAMLLMEDDPSLAMLLAHTALPEDLQEPDYPLTPAADLAVRSTALRHQYEEATAVFTTRTRLAFHGTDWRPETFYDNGRYFTVLEPGRTRLYEARTGTLIADVPAESVWFLEGCERYVVPSGEAYCVEAYCVYDVRTGEEVARYEGIAPSEDYVSLSFDNESGRVWLVNYSADSTVGWFDREGVLHEEHTGIEDLDSYIGADYLYPHGDSGVMFGKDVQFVDDVPDAELDRDTVLRALNTVFGAESCRIDGMSKCADEGFYILQCEVKDIGWRYAVWAAEEERLIYLDEYPCFQEADSKLFYRMLDEELHILELHPENLDLPQTSPPFEYVSENGMYGFGTYETMWNDQWEYRVFFAHDTSKLEDVLVERGYFLEKPGDYQYADPDVSAYDVTPDGTRAVAKTRDGHIQLIDIVEGRVLCQLDVSGQEVVDVAVSDNGVLFAYTTRFGETVKIRVIDGNTREYIAEKTIYDEGAEFSELLEIRGNSMLVHTGENVYLFDLEDLAREPRRIPLSGHLFDPFTYLVQPLMTADGLLVLPTIVLSPVANSYTVGQIIDAETGEQIGFQDPGDSYYDQNYWYDERNGHLILQTVNGFIVQRRGESGDFEVAYTITPRHGDMIMDSAGRACDGTWLLLQNDEYCEIYRLSDGELCYILPKPDDRSCQFGVIDGRLYDFCMGWDRVCIPLPDTGEARDYVREALSYDGGRRSLTDQEMQDYYIPSHWQEK